MLGRPSVGAPVSMKIRHDRLWGGHGGPPLQGFGDKP